MSRNRFAPYAWAVLALNLAVILWGAVVRATGSGAGCGSNWPTCDGAALPALADAETTIEFVHRATSGVAILAVLALYLWARRDRARGDRVRSAAAVSLAFMVIEAAIGAALVLFGWVDEDTSVGRVFAIAVHLGNTFFLLAALTATAWWATDDSQPEQASPATARLVVIGLVALIVVGAVGAVTALGDTLFPEGIGADDLSARSRFLVRLRVVHPVLAVAAAGYLLGLLRRGGTWATTPARLAAILVAVQLVAGVLNVALKAPLWMQLVHLALADLLWVALVVVALTAGVPERLAAARTPKASMPA